MGAQASAEAPAEQTTAPKLTLKQQRFVDAYVEHGNATKAAEMAGYRGSSATLSVIGHENLKKALIDLAIQEKLKSEPVVASRRQRQAFWTEVMLNKREAMTNRLRASELLAKASGDFFERRSEDQGPVKEDTATLIQQATVAIEFLKTHSKPKNKSHEERPENAALYP